MSNIPCLICGRKQKEFSTKGGDDDTDNISIISKQLTVIFILRNVLQVPTSQLQSYLENLGNPDDWITLCEQCTKLTNEACSLHFQILKISSNLKALRNEIVELAKRPVNSFPPPKLKLTPKITVWKETRSFVQKRNLKFNKSHNKNIH